MLRKTQFTVLQRASCQDQNGVQQGQHGDILRPLLFFLALMPSINKLKQEMLILLQNTWYLDDGILAGIEAELKHSLDILENE